MSDEALFDRLRRLRREAAAPLPEASAQARAETARPARAAGPPGELTTFRGEHGEFSVRERGYTGAHRHGRWRLDEALAASLEDVALVAGDPALRELDLARAVYLDIETTGLAGGAGTIPFLVALGGFEEEPERPVDGADAPDPTEADRGPGFRLWQGFLVGPEQERALLAEVARRVRASAGIVSFFGKSFDRHRLEDKMRLHGIDPPFEDRPHLDLFHPLARLYRSALADGRLATVEAELCGVARTDDLPGSFAPEAWYDFLSGRAHRLEAVFRHNADDVLSLVVLAAHLGRTRAESRVAGEALGGSARARAGALARLFAARREHADALAWIERALERVLERDSADARALRVLRADVRRVTGEDGAALEEYELLAAEARDEHAVHSLVQIAKLAEHRLRDLDRAAAAVDRARRLAETCVRAARRERTLEELRHRARRLGAKRSRSAL